MTLNLQPQPIRNHKTGAYNEAIYAQEMVLTSFLKGNCDGNYGDFLLNKPPSRSWSNSQLIKNVSAQLL